MTDPARVERLNRAILDGYSAFLLAHRTPTPTWADVREAYRAGWMAGVAALGREVGEAEEAGEQT